MLFHSHNSVDDESVTCMMLYSWILYYHDVFVLKLQSHEDVTLKYQLYYKNHEITAHRPHEEAKHEFEAV
jgi:hypothetical protein